MDDGIANQTATVASGASAVPAREAHGASGTAGRISGTAPEEGRFVSGTLVAGRYGVISLLGRGGMGEVCRATDRMLAQPVAPKYWLADVVSLAWNAVQSGLIVVFAIFVLRAICRKEWLASIAAAVLFTAREGEVWHDGQVAIAIAYVVIFTGLAFVLLRLGLVSTIVAIFLVNLLNRTPGAQSLTAWYEWAVIAYRLLALAIVLWAFWNTSGEQALCIENG